MAEYLKLFENHTDYEAYISDNPTTPNVSYCTDVRDVHYNPAIINFASNVIKQLLITSGADLNNDGEIDIYEAQKFNNFSAFMYFSLNTPYSFDEFRFFTSVTTAPIFVSTPITSIVLPDSITTLPGGFFDDCDEIVNIVIPESVTTINGSVTHFSKCNKLESVTFMSQTPPTIENADNFTNNASGFKIYVPADSVNAYKEATNWSAYASIINAIPSAS